MPEPALSKKSILLKGGKIVNHDLIKEADILIQNGIIINIGINLPIPDETEILDVRDKYVLPGGIDLDCHLSVPSKEDPVADTYRSGSTCALLGGTTTIVNSVYTEPDASIVEAFKQFQATAQGEFKCNFAVCMRLPRFDEQIAKEMEQLVKEHGVCVVQLPVDQDEEIIRSVMTACRNLGILPTVIASGSANLVRATAKKILSEHPNIGPELHEYSQTERAEMDTILRTTMHAFNGEQVCPILIKRIQSNLALDCFLRQRRNYRSIIFGQTTIGAIGAPLAAIEQTQTDEALCFVTSTDWVRSLGCISEPPIRPDVTISQRLLHEMNLHASVSVGSAHCAIGNDVRAAFIGEHLEDMPKGVATLGCRLPVLWNCGVEKGLSLCALVQAVSTEPAKLINLYPQKGQIAIGSDADLVVWGWTETDETGYAKLLPSDVYNIFSGLNLQMLPRMVLLGGNVVVNNGCIVNENLTVGNYIKLKPYAPYTYSRLNAIDSSLVREHFKITREPYNGKVADTNPQLDTDKTVTEHHFFRKDHYDNVPKVALPPGQRQIRTSVKTAQPPGGASQAFW